MKNITYVIDDTTLAIKLMKSLASNLSKTLYEQSSMQDIISTLEMIEDRLGTLRQVHSFLKEL